jgi:enamine deaminase RidA (YjgF/YER057c/UK114 family)
LVISHGHSINQTPAQFSILDLGDALRLSVISTPRSRGTISEQAVEAFSALNAVLAEQSRQMFVINQTVFLRDSHERVVCEELLAAQYGTETPPTNFVFHPPCDGAALAIEAWAIGGKAVQVEQHGPHTLSVSYHGIRWVHCVGVKPGAPSNAVYPQVIAGLEQMRGLLTRAGSGFEHVVRTWFHLSDITGPDTNKAQRYHELNRARTDFFHGINFCHSLLDPQAPRGLFPASSGVGMSGAGLVMSCLAVQTGRADAFLLPLENPHQTPAFAYHPKYSPKSPKFSRAIALVMRNYVTAWISGTASVVNSESCHLGDIKKQTHQTIENLERLISPENFSFHGVPGCGATLHNLAKARVYLKRPQDFSQCRAICERHFRTVPVVYAVADICRPELLVEIEGVAFSKNQRPRG